LKTDQNAVDATDATRASRDCCSDVNAAWAWARKASKSMASACCCGCAGAGSCEPANSQTPAIARVSATRRTRIGKPPGLPLPRTQPYLEFYLNHAKVNDESPRAAFSID
jgi:hypothetical protein